MIFLSFFLNFEERRQFREKVEKYQTEEKLALLYSASGKDISFSGWTEIKKGKVEADNQKSYLEQKEDYGEKGRQNKEIIQLINSTIAINNQNLSFLIMMHHKCTKTGKAREHPAQL